MVATGTISNDRLPSLNGKVWISGGAGYLAKAIYTRAQTEKWDCRFTCYSRDEAKQWYIKNQFGDLVDCVLGDIRDEDATLLAVQGHDVVIHAAAIKFIPEAEFNVAETIKTNIEGSMNVLWASWLANVKKVIAISTDKACLPVNSYGMTKALMERMVGEASRWSDDTKFAAVRYGNVVGSTGSIIPVFRKQLAERGRVTVTNKDMTRFWISPDDAVDLILLALAQCEELSGRVFAPRCGAMRIGHLADLIAAGAPIDIIGVRPGEKEHEDLVHYKETTRVDVLGDYFVIHPPTMLGDNASGWTYSSHNPSHWITPEEMSVMITEAKKL